MSTRVFRPGRSYTIVGLLLIVVGFTITAAIEAAMVMLRSSAWDERPSYLLLGFVLMLIGLLHLLVGRNQRVEVGPHGIVGTDLFGRESFRVTWPQVQAIERRPRASKGGPFFEVTSNQGERLAVSSTYADHEEFLDAVLDHAPTVTYRVLDH
jgi:hypothetical protein